MGTKLCQSEITAINKLRREPTKKTKAQKSHIKNKIAFEKSYWYLTYVNKDDENILPTIQ